jgi:hypothetical protein
MSYTTIDNPELYFQCKLWTGNDGSNALTLDGDENMQPDLVWLTPRNKTDNKRIQDSVRGAGKMLPSNSSGAEESLSEFVSFDTDGFTLNTSDGGYNSSSYNYVAWCWKESADAGFDIVSFTGNATNRTISHSLSAVPDMVIVKNRSDSVSWKVWHNALAGTKYLEIDTNGAEATGATVWNSTTPTSSVFSVGTANSTNGSSDNIIAYCFAEKQGFSKFAKYTGNGNADGPFCYCGFRPAFVMVKRADSAREWMIWDNKRDTYNPTKAVLHPDNTAVEDSSTSYEMIDVLSTGFKLRQSDVDTNASGGTYIFYAVAEAPLVNSKSVPCNGK